MNRTLMFYQYSTMSDSLSRFISYREDGKYYVYGKSSSSCTYDQFKNYRKHESNGFSMEFQYEE